MIIQLRRLLSADPTLRSTRGHLPLAGLADTPHAGLDIPTPAHKACRTRVVESITGRPQREVPRREKNKTAPIP